MLEIEKSEYIGSSNQKAELFPMVCMLKNSNYVVMIRASEVMV
jgi:hypothetical protein